MSKKEGIREIAENKAQYMLTTIDQTHPAPYHIRNFIQHSSVRCTGIVKAEVGWAMIGWPPSKPIRLHAPSCSVHILAWASILPAIIIFQETLFTLFFHADDVDVGENMLPKKRRVLSETPSRNGCRTCRWPWDCSSYYFRMLMLPAAYARSSATRPNHNARSVYPQAGSATATVLQHQNLKEAMAVLTVRFCLPLFTAVARSLPRLSQSHLYKLL